MIFALKNSVSADNRKEVRHNFSAPCSVRRWGRTFPAITRNISTGGVCLDVQGMGSTAHGAELTILLRDLPAMTAVARWSHKRTFGLQFLEPVEDHFELAMLIDELERAE